MTKILLINDTSHESHIGSRAVLNTITSLCEKNDMIITNKLTRGEVFKSGNDLIKNINNCDIVVINGEGSLHHHPTSSSNFFPYLLKHIPKQKKIALINTIWQDMYYPKVKIDLEKINLISVRESFSYKNIIQYCDKSKIRIVPDLIFASSIKTNPIGYCDSIYHKIRSTFKRKENYFPLNFIDNGTYKKPIDLTYPTLEAYISWLKSLEVFITGRFHGVCLAMLTDTPFLTYGSNSHKIEGVLFDANCSDLLITQNKDIETKQELSKKLIKNCNPYVKEAEIKIKQLFRDIKKL